MTSPEPGLPVTITGSPAGEVGRDSNHLRDRPAMAPSADLPDTAGTGTPGTDVVSELQGRIAELGDSLRRVLAAADNVRKRHAREVGRVREEEQAHVARELLPVLDNLDRALKNAGTDPGAIAESVRTVRDQAADVLAHLGFPRRDDLGARFDPARHEVAGARWYTAAEPGTVVEVVRPAYGDGERQLRPALVVVARGD